MNSQIKSQLEDRASRFIPIVPDLKTVVWATDFSEQSDAALRWLLEFAGDRIANLHIVHAVDSSLAWLSESNECVGNVIRNNLVSIGDKITHKCISVQTNYSVGKPWDIVARIASRTSADLIVVGAHGHSTMVGRILGATANRLIRATFTPVLVHRQNHQGLTHGIRTIVCAYDFSQESARAIGSALSFFRDQRKPQRLVLLHALPIPVMYVDVNVPIPSPEYWNDIEADARHKLSEFASQLLGEGLELATKVVRDDPADAILQEAYSSQADLITIGTVGRTGVNRFLMGSVAERVLHYATCSVLTVHRANEGVSHTCGCGDAT